MKRKKRRRMSSSRGAIRMRKRRDQEVYEEEIKEKDKGHTI